jgi:hypothetical protein
MTLRTSSARILPSIDTAAFEKIRYLLKYRD